MFVFRQQYWNKFNILAFILILWIYEWFFFFEEIVFQGTTLTWFKPFKVPLILLLLFSIWIIIWGISAWRRTLFGRFVRGDKKLWYKSLVSFWIIEISTVGGLVLAAAWVYWGPKHFVPRRIFYPTSGFIFELIIFSYIWWLLYLLKYSLKWNHLASFSVLVTSILGITGILLWRDLCTLWTRELLSPTFGSRYRFIKLQSLLYSLDQEWWFEMYMGQKASHYSWFLPLTKLCRLHLKPNFLAPLTLIEYEEYIWQPYYSKALYLSNATSPLRPTIHRWNHFRFIDDLDTTSIAAWNSHINLDTNQFLPRRLGFLPKKLALWYFLVILKMWHHLMIFFWWLPLLVKITALRKTSFSYVNMGQFNLYCCFLLGWAIYFVQIFPSLEWLMRVKPLQFGIALTSHITTDIWEYFISLATTSKTTSLSIHKTNWKFFINTLKHFQVIY